MSQFLLSFIFGIIAIEAQLQQEMILHLLSKNEVGGQCLDSSPAGFYYSAPPSDSSDLWVIVLQGGGACGTKAACMKRANTSQGSSNYWSQTHPIFQKINSNNPSVNPDFYQAHQVYAPYCSGDAWSGQRSTPSTDPNTWGLYFSGHLIFEQIIQYLQYNLSSASLLDAQYILLTGFSAGGKGTFGNINWLYNEMKKSATYKDNITIKAAPDAGWIYPGNTTDQPTDPMMPPNNYPHWIKGENGGPGHNESTTGEILWDSYFDPNCVSALGSQNAWHCQSVYNGFKYIVVPIFVLQNKYDSYQIQNSFSMPNDVVNNQTIGYVEYFGMDMDRSIITQLVDEKNDKNGLFYASCFDHSGLGFPQSTVVIKGYTCGEIVGDWFWERNKLPHFVYDTCNDEKNQLPCNPTCDSYPPKSG